MPAVSKIRVPLTDPVAIGLPGASTGMCAGSGIDNFLLVFGFVTALVIIGGLCSGTEEDDEEPVDCRCRRLDFFIVDIELIRIDLRPSSSEPKMDSTDGGR